jgi:hypothetical protein
VDMGAHLIDVGANPEPMEAHSLYVKLPLESMRRGGHSGAMEDYSGAMEVHHGAMETHPAAMEANPGATETAHPGAMGLTLETWRSPL